MVNAYRAVRQFERLMDPNYRELMYEEPKNHPQPTLRNEEGKLIATIVETITRDAQGRIVDREITFEKPETSK